MDISSLPNKRITALELETEQMHPLPLSGGDSSLEEVLHVIESELARAAVGSISVVRVTVWGVTTRTSKEVDKPLPKEFFSVGLLVSGRHSELISVLRLRPIGSVATVTLEWKRIFAPKQQFGPALLRFLHPLKEEGEEITGLVKNIGSFTGCLVSLIPAALVGTLAGTLWGKDALLSATVATAALVFEITRRLTMHFTKRQEEEVEALRTSATITLANAYVKALECIEIKSGAREELYSKLLVTPEEPNRAQGWDRD